MAKHFFQADDHQDGVAIRLYGRRLIGGPAMVPVDDWAGHASEDALPEVAKILVLLAEDVDAKMPRVRAEDDAVVVTHAAVAALTEPQAAVLGLPGSAPLMLNIQSRGNLAQRDFELKYSWLNQSSRPAFGAERRGALLTLGLDRYRVPEPLYSIAEAIDGFRAADTTDDATRFRHLARLMEMVPPPDTAVGAPALAVDVYLRNTRIMHAAAFSLRLRTEANGFQFEPILFGRRVKDRAAEDGGPVSEAEGLLTEALQDVFARQRFPRWIDCRDRYGLADGTYVYVDPALQKALTVVRRMQGADPETRRRFARNPRVFMKEVLDGEIDDATVEHLFIETEQYSQRVVDVGRWVQASLSWLEHQPNTWLPERFAVSLGGLNIALSPQEVEPLRKAVSEAVAEGRTTVDYQGQSIPANETTIGVLHGLAGLVRPEDKVEQETTEPAVEAAVETVPYFLIVDENLEKVSFRKERRVRGAGHDTGVPGSVRSTLKPHQTAGLDWLQRGWLAGLPGQLLADDMGLGKSLQALAFISWMQGVWPRSSGGDRPGPILVVAPTGLLANWREEAEKHLHDPGLGELCAAYGNGLSSLKSRRERDIHRGEPSLDGAAIQRAEWVMTTYETLRDYHHSFAAIRFSAVVFDEMQKLKNPTSQLARAAKTLNADFVLGLTGTPIENRLEDLWAIMDIAYPGFLGEDLKSFSAKYKPNDHASLRQLRDILMEPSDEAPPIILRRMKTDHLKGLPKKNVHAKRATMPPAQAEAYADIVRSAASGRRGAMLETLHSLRGVSLHPIDPQQGRSFDPEVYCGMSARLSTAFEILDEVHRRREKALIFLESRDMQSLLAVLLKKRFKLDHLPLLINGAVAGESRQRAVREFQSPSRRGFDVMILSPKAGGVGLTLTAANHVFHLSRWWNPAVEDQCTDRIYRIGQDRDIHVYYPMAVHPSPEIAEFSFDLKLNELLDRKRSLSRDMLMPPISPMADEGELYAATIERAAGATRRDADEASVVEIDRMDPIEFEHWAIRRLAARGYRPNRTPSSGDGGADGVLVHAETEERVILQCKHRQPGDACDDEPIDDLLRARSAYGGADRLIALTNASRFTASARERAARYDVILIARDQISHWPNGCC